LTKLAIKLAGKQPCIAGRPSQQKGGKTPVNVGQAVAYAIRHYWSMIAG
jgi:hypothetical protein